MKRLIALPALPLVALLGAVTIPAAGQEGCATWTAEMLEDEGGPVLTAWVCDARRPDAQLLLTCAADEIWIRYDLSAGSEASPELGETVDVTFTTGQGSATLAMPYQEMDGRHAADVGVDAPLVGLLRDGDRVTIRDAAGRYPERSLSLAGSSGAIGTLLAACR